MSWLLSAHNQVITVLRALWFHNSAPWELSVQRMARPGAAFVHRGKLVYQTHTATLQICICSGIFVHVLNIQAHSVSTASMFMNFYKQLIISSLFCLYRFYCPVSSNGTVHVSYECPVGHYCPFGTWSKHQYPCPAGTINPHIRMAKAQDCLPCPPGHTPSVINSN